MSCVVLVNRLDCSIGWTVHRSCPLYVTNYYLSWTLAIAPWILLRLSFCDPRLKSQAHHLSFFSICMVEIGMRKGRKLTQKRPDLAHI